MEKLIITAGGRLKVWSYPGSFDTGITALRTPDEIQEKPSLELTTSEEFATIRMQYGPGSLYSQKGAWVAESYLNKKDEVIIASRGLSPVLKHPGEATKAHYRGRKFYVDNKEWKQLREVADSDPYKAMESGALLVKRKDLNPEIYVEELGETPETVFLFREQAKAYGNWLKEQSIKVLQQTVRVDYVDSDKKHDDPSAWAVWVHGFPVAQLGVGYGGPYGLSDSYGRVHGVCIVPAERAEQEAPQHSNGADAAILDAVKSGTTFSHNGFRYICKKTHR